MNKKECQKRKMTMPPKNEAEKNKKGEDKLTPI